MADNILLNAGSGGEDLATDQIPITTGPHYQRVKLIHGADGTNDGDVSTANPYPVDIREIGGAAVATGGGVESGALRVTIANDSTGVLSVDDGGANLSVDWGGTVPPIGGGLEATALRVTIASDSTGQVTIDGTVTANLSATDNAVLDNIDTSTAATAAGFVADDGALGTGVLIQGDDGTNRKNVNVDATTGDVQVDVTNTVTVDGTGGTFPVTNAGLTELAAAINTNRLDVNIAADGVSLATAANQTTTNAWLDSIDTSAANISSGYAANGAPYGDGVLIQGDDGTDRQNIAVSPTTGNLQIDIATELPAGTQAIGKLAANSGVDIGDVDVTSIAAGANLIGDVGLSGARTSGGTTYKKFLDVDETEEEVKATAGQIYFLHAVNLTSSPLYLKFYDNTTATVVVGTTAPDLTFPIPTQGDSNGAGFTLSIPNGIEFTTAITIACTTGVGDTDSGAPGLNACVVNLGFA